VSLTRVCAADELAAGEAVRITFGDVPICLARDEDGRVHAVGDLCTHGEVSLSEGDVEGCTVECWLHGSAFDLRTGQALTPPAFEPIPVFDCVEQDGDIYIDPEPNPATDH
jgi:3-phenylpropionate/trans-cinnamate dioxygenase ferredoxin subunit